MHLSKSFDCLNHEVLLAILNAYGHSTNAMQIVYSYLTRRRQRGKVNGSFSSWNEMKASLKDQFSDLSCLIHVSVILSFS